MKKIMLNLAFWLDKHLGCHNCDKFDETGYYGICKYCGKKCLLDSQGNWFEV